MFTRKYDDDYNFISRTIVVSQLGIVNSCSSALCVDLLDLNSVILKNTDSRFHNRDTGVASKGLIASFSLIRCFYLL